MALIANCPSCDRQLRVPDDLVGRQVKCAQCGTVFTPGGTAEPVEAVDVASPYAAAPTGVPSGGVVERAKSIVMGPAICLIFVAVLNFLIGVWLLVEVLPMFPPDDQVIEKFHSDLKDRFERPNAPGENPFKTREGAEQFLKTMLLGMIVCGAISVPVALLTLVGAIKALRLRSTGLAKFASVLIMIPFLTSPCCLLGIPFGIWSLVALNKPEVNAAVKSLSSTGGGNTGSQGEYPA